MGRLSKATGRPSFRIHYSKLVDEYSGSCETLKFMPSLPEYLSYCCHQCGHQQTLKAEELNSIVGNAFRMAYAAQLQKQPSFQDVISSQLDQTQTDKVVWTKELTVSLKKETVSSPSRNNQSVSMDIELNSSDASTLRIAPPSSIPGLKPAHKYNVLEPPDKSQSQQSTPSSDESNSPTEMNSYKRMTEKPLLIKRIAMGISNSHQRLQEEDCPPDLPTFNPGRRLSGGYENEPVKEALLKSSNKPSVENLKDDFEDSPPSNNTKHLEIKSAVFLPYPPAEHEFKTKRISQISSSSTSSAPTGHTPTPPPLPERLDSLNNKEEAELRQASWFQPGIPREIALEVLNQDEVGAFMVRNSTSKPGCYALSLRVPRSFQPTGIAHYLIVRTNKGYKIKGFTKEFGTLKALVTHHSVMPELLPCTLSLSRHNPTFQKSDSQKDFADIDLDPEYNSLADFRRMMADLKL